MKENIRKAFAEINDIILHSEIEIQMKIPYKLKKLIKDNMDINYDIKIDYAKSINEQRLLSETRDILAMIYRDYLCKEERIEYTQNTKEIEKKYDITKIFKNEKQDNTLDTVLTLELDKKKYYESVMQFMKNITQK